MVAFLSEGVFLTGTAASRRITYTSAGNPAQTVTYYFLLVRMSFT
jgi:hypothetical protein